MGKKNIRWKIKILKNSDAIVFQILDFDLKLKTYRKVHSTLSSICLHLPPPQQTFPGIWRSLKSLSLLEVHVLSTCTKSIICATRSVPKSTLHVLLRSFSSCRPMNKKVSYVYICKPNDSRCFSRFIYRDELLSHCKAEKESFFNPITFSSPGNKIGSA